MKRKKVMIMHGLLVLGWFIASASGHITSQEKPESVTLTPIPTLSPPEGNMTFIIDGATWCMARPGASQDDLQNALDWAVRCYQSNPLVTHASYAFNIFYGSISITATLTSPATSVASVPSSSAT
ncbi:hypothetical protein HU200_016270 [Digitaria exilis]|uniref:X8 domain-containing protein n=1 Tax=Digitaria exilis TaxID=1010633 RepID=A0A835F9J6_9POAL|nr:hypothetical protein HU200_016270 [Digitaria exilis]